LIKKKLIYEKIGGSSDWNCVSYSEKKLKGRIYVEINVVNVNSDTSGFFYGVTSLNKGSSYTDQEGTNLSNQGISSGGKAGVLIDMKKLSFWFFKDGKYTNEVRNMEKGKDYFFCVHNYYVGDKYSLKFPSKIPKNPK